MSNTTKDIVNKFLNKNKKANAYSAKSGIKSPFSFKDSSSSKNTSTKSSISSNINCKNSISNVEMDQKIFKQIFEILKMRLYIESIMNIKDEDLRDIIRENYNLINLRDYDIQSINKFVDDLVEIAKEENKKIKEMHNNKIMTNISSKSKINNVKNNYFYESNDCSLNYMRRKTIQLNTIGYRPTSVVTQRRRTIEIFLEKPKGNLKNDSMKFNMFEKSLTKNYSFYEGDPYNPENNISVE